MLSWPDASPRRALRRSLRRPAAGGLPPARIPPPDLSLDPAALLAQVREAQAPARSGCRARPASTLRSPRAPPASGSSPPRSGRTGSTWRSSTSSATRRRCWWPRWPVRVLRRPQEGPVPRGRHAGQPLAAGPDPARRAGAGHPPARLGPAARRAGGPGHAGADPGPAAAGAGRRGAGALDRRPGRGGEGRAPGGAAGPARGAGRWSSPGTRSGAAPGSPAPWPSARRRRRSRWSSSWSDVEVNGPLDPRLFELQVPRGARVVELGEGAP